MVRSGLAAPLIHVRECRVKSRQSCACALPFATPGANSRKQVVCGYRDVGRAPAAEQRDHVLTVSLRREAGAILWQGASTGAPLVEE
jgi:hypothetical protein